MLADIMTSRRTVREAIRYFEREHSGKYYIYVARYADEAELSTVNMKNGVVLQYTGEESLCSVLEECDKAYIFENNGNDIREQLSALGYTDLSDFTITLHSTPLNGYICKNDLLMLVYRGSLNDDILRTTFNNYCNEGFQERTSRYPTL